jgi:exopolysaccharide biosynthesis polyprenyl glycosylphosphotransferase
MSTAVNSLDERLRVGEYAPLPSPVDAGLGVESLPASRAGAGRTHFLGMRWWHVCLSLDALLLVAASVAASLGARSANVAPLPILWSVAFSFCVILVFAARGLYPSRLRVRPLDELRGVVIGVGLASILIVVGRALVVDGSEALVEVARLFVFTTVYVGAGRFSLSRWQDRVRRDGDGRSPTLVLGSGRSATVAAQRLLARPELGFEPVGFVNDDMDDVHGPLPVLGSSSELELVLHEHAIEQLLIAPSGLSEERIVEIADRCDEAGVSVGFIPQLAEKTTRRLSVEHVGGLPLVFLESSDPHGWKFRIKYALDRVLAALLCFVALPLLVAAAVAVWRSLGRPIFYEQRRVGRDGKEFGLLKFRSMRQADEDETFALPLDADTAPGGVEGTDRRTRVGSFLRRTAIDELPQLLNVLKGDMSLVGPRPERPEFVAHFQDSIRRYDKRLRVKSGITGWAQVNGLRGKTSVSDRVEWDNHYIENWSPWLDFKIMFSTFTALLSSFKYVE